MVVDDIYSKYQYNINFCKMKIIKIDGEKKLPISVTSISIFAYFSVFVKLRLSPFHIWGGWVNTCIYFIPLCKQL